MKLGMPNQPVQATVQSPRLMADAGDKTMKRRAFLKTRGASVAGAVVGSELGAREDEKRGEERSGEEVPMKTEAERLTAYCGRYCGVCGICGHYARTGLAAIGNVVEAAGFKREAERLGWPLMRDLPTHCCTQFETQVQSFAELAPKFFASNCRGGCVPPCEIAKCCKGREHTTCAECGDLAACSKIAELAKKYPEVKVNLQEIAKHGIRQWAQAQFDAARAARKQMFTEAIEKPFR